MKDWIDRLLSDGVESEMEIDRLTAEQTKALVTFSYHAAMYRRVYTEFREAGWGRVGAFVFTLDTYHRFVQPMMYHTVVDDPDWQRGVDE